MDLVGVQGLPAAFCALYLVLALGRGLGCYIFATSASDTIAIDVLELVGRTSGPASPDIQQFL